MNNKREGVINRTIQLARNIEKQGLTYKNLLRWHKLKRDIKRYKRLEPRTKVETIKSYVFDSTKLTNEYLCLDLVYYSDRWTRQRTYLFDFCINTIYKRNKFIEGVTKNETRKI